MRRLLYHHLRQTGLCSVGLLCLVTSSFAVFAQDSISSGILSRIYLSSDPMDDAMTLSLYNPSLYQYRRDVSLGDVSVQYGHAHTDEFWQGGAEAYIKHKNSTLWGNAHYDNGKLKDIGGSMTRDTELLYPYFTTVEMPEDDCEVKLETYSLGGGFADHSGGWSHGVTLSYEAGLYYRDIDPRPKNITGRLMLNAGAAYALTGGHLVAVSAGLGKYSQSCDIMFVSETGRSPIYHMTGPESCYNRFTGASESSNYSGKIYEATVGLFPKSRRGVIASVNLSRFEFGKTLTDLNNLPLCRAWHNQVDAMGGWISKRWSVWGGFAAWRRHGIENLFGDATSGVYPEIGAVEMYADNQWAVSLHSIADLPVAGGSVYIKTDAGYAHRSTIYLEPAYVSIENRWDANLGIGARALLRSWTVNASFAYGYAHHARIDHNTNAMQAACTLGRGIGKYAAALQASWQKDMQNDHCYDIALMLFF